MWIVPLISYGGSIYGQSNTTNGLGGTCIRHVGVWIKWSTICKIYCWVCFVELKSLIQISVMFVFQSPVINASVLVEAMAWWGTGDKLNHDDVIKSKRFPRYWPFVRGIHRSPVNSPHKGQWHRALMGFFYLRLSNQSWGWWFETLSRPLWLHRNDCLIQWWPSLTKVSKIVGYILPRIF